jgi:5-methylcytosine-specific restriction endonuclease McrA
MPSKPNTVCAGSCGRLIWPNYSSASQPICRECRAQPEQPSFACVACENMFPRRSTGNEAKTCLDCRRTRRSPSRDWARLTDITPEYELMLRAKAKRCSLCTVKLTDQPYLPNSKELDHIIPKGIGGTHTIGNVRILCRRCNIARPKDGSDYTGPVTLWAEVA